MLKDIKKASESELKKTFNCLDPDKTSVIWIRNLEMTQQIFMSDGYEHIWQRDPAELYDSPFMWFDFLVRENKVSYMKQLEARHNQGYHDIDKNVVWYQVYRPDQTIAHIQCRCQRYISPNNQYYIVGISEKVEPQQWDAAYANKQAYQSDNYQSLKKQLDAVLQKKFGLRVDMPLNTTDELLKRFYENIKLSFEVTLSAREMEAIFHLCQGKSAKEIGKLLNLSHRTVETHIYNIREKMGCPNKLTLISLFRPLIPG